METKELDFKKLKKSFDLKDETEDVRKAIDDIKEEIVDKRFNPDRTPLSDLHDIMDDIQVIQTKLGKLKQKGLRQELRAKLYITDINMAYDKKYDKLLLIEPTKDDKDKNILKANIEAKVKEKLSDEEFYKNIAMKKEFKIKSYIKEIDAFIYVMSEMDDKCSRKISLMSLQRELGVLIDVKKRK